MGKGHEQKQQEQHENLENARLAAATSPAQGDLFENTPPKTARQLEVLATNTLPEGAETLCARYSGDGMNVEFIHGEVPVAAIGRAEFDHLGVPTDATLFHIVANDGEVIRLESATVDRRSHRTDGSSDEN